LRSLALIAGSLILAGCGGVHGDYTSSQSGPSPIVLTDTSPGQLAVLVGLNMGGYDAATRHTTLMHASFQHGDRPVNFIGGEQFVCDGVVPKRFIGSFELSYPTDAIAGKAMKCVYTSGQQSTSISFKVPPELAIVAPREHEQVPRSSNTMVSYSGGMHTDMWVVALSPNLKSVAQPKDITSNSAKLDTTTFQAGPGSIALTDPNSFPLTEIQGARFQSISATARRMTGVNVLWA
jgi:hypothetical protein